MATLGRQAAWQRLLGGRSLGLPATRGGCGHTLLAHRSAWSHTLCSGHALDALKGATHVLSTVPPDDADHSEPDPVIFSHAQSLSEGAERYSWVGYVSSTSGAQPGGGCRGACRRGLAELRRAEKAGLPARTTRRCLQTCTHPCPPPPPSRRPAVYGDWQGEWVDEESELRATGGKVR